MTMLPICQGCRVPLTGSGPCPICGLDPGAERRETRNAALEQAAELANAVYMSLIGKPKPCPCGNGRIPTGAYRVAADAYAKAIRDLIAT